MCPGPKLPKQPMTPTVSLRYVTAEASRILTRKSFIHQSQPFNCLKGVTYRPTICKAEQCDQIRGFFSAGRIWVGSGARSDMEQVRELLLTLLYSAAEVQMPPTTATESWTIYPTASFLTHWDWGVRRLAAGGPTALGIWLQEWPQLTNSQHPEVSLKSQHLSLGLLNAWNTVSVRSS